MCKNSAKLRDDEYWKFWSIRYKKNKSVITWYITMKIQTVRYDLLLMANLRDDEYWKFWSIPYKKKVYKG